MIHLKKTTFPALLLVLSIVHFVPAEELGGDLCSSTANCSKNYVCITGTCQTCKEAVKSGDYPMECGLHPSIIVVFVIFGVIFWINVFACCWLCDCCPIFKCRIARNKNKGVEAGTETETETVTVSRAGVGARAGPKAASGRGLKDKAKSTSKLNLSFSPSNASQKLESKPEPTPATAAAHLTTKTKQKKKKKLNSTPTPPPTPPTV